MATIKEIAKRANVSTATVSHVLTGAVRVSPELRRRVEAVIKELDYHPSFVARSLKMKRTHLLGLIISDVTNPFFPQLVRGVEDAAMESEFLVVTFNSDDRPERERKMLSVLRSRRVDGILLVPAPSDGDSSHLKGLIKAGIPLVCLDRVPSDVSVDSVSVANESGSLDCVTHLISQGHRRIGMINGRSAGFFSARERLKGYREALETAQIAFDGELVREGDFRNESGYSLCLELMRLPDPPSALFVTNNTMAMGALTALRDLGLQCPNDIAVAVFDDLPYMSALCPPLTAVSQPAYDVGYQGVQLLLRRIQGTEKASVPISIQLPTELRIRESTNGGLKAGQAKR